MLFFEFLVFYLYMSLLVLRSRGVEENKFCSFDDLSDIYF